MAETDFTDFVVDIVPRGDMSLADAIDVIAAIDDPDGPAAERVRLATDPFYACVWMINRASRSLRVPKEMLGEPQA